MIQPFMSIQEDCLLIYFYLLYYITCQLKVQYMHACTPQLLRILLMSIMSAAYPLDTVLERPFIYFRRVSLIAISSLC